MATAPEKRLQIVLNLYLDDVLAATDPAALHCTVGEGCKDWAWLARLCWAYWGDLVVVVELDEEPYSACQACGPLTWDDRAGHFRVGL